MSKNDQKGDEMGTTSWDELPVVLTASECARLLRLHINTVMEKLNKGELPGKKVGRQWRVEKSRLREYVEGMK